MLGNLPSFDQSNFPESTMAPPMEVPLPDRNLVVEWMTKVAPHSIGRQSQGEAMVLSTISGTPASSAIFAIASMSLITPPGLARLSMKNALVLGVNALRKFSGSSASTNFADQPNLG